MLINRHQFVNQLEMALNIDPNGPLFVKTIDQKAFDGGIGLFNSNEDSHLAVNPGIHHMIKVLNKLYNSNARDFVEFPISIVTPSENFQNYQIIFRNLSKLGYQIGAPNRITQEELFTKYVFSLKSAINHIHDAGVIHCDLYLSNVMWRINSETDNIDIKIIDWDCSHSIDEGNFHPKIHSRLNEYLAREPKFSIEHDHLYLQIFDLEKECYQEYWQSLASNNKKEIDYAFHQLLMVILTS